MKVNVPSVSTKSKWRRSASPRTSHLCWSPVPPAITLETVQVNEISDIISWQPPAEPNGQILHYNIRIYRLDRDGNQELVDTVSEVQETMFDFSTRGLNTGTYNIQVGHLCESIKL